VEGGLGVQLEVTVVYRGGGDGVLEVFVFGMATTACLLREKRINRMDLE